VKEAHRIAQRARRKVREFLEEALSQDPDNNTSGFSVRLGPAGSWFMVISVVPDHHPHDG
jgi:hypothetical protein